MGMLGELNYFLAKKFPEYDIYATMKGGNLTLIILFEHYIPEMSQEEKNRLWDLATNFLRQQMEKRRDKSMLYKGYYKSPAAI